MKFLTLLWDARRYILEPCSMCYATPPSTPWETVIMLYVLNFLPSNAKRQSEVFVQKFHTILLEAQQLNWNQVELRWGFSATFVTLDGFSTFPTFLHTHSQQQLNSECVKIFCSFFISPAIIIHTVWNDVLIYPFARASPSSGIGNDVIVTNSTNHSYASNSMCRHIASNSNDQWTSLPFLKKGEIIF